MAPAPKRSQETQEATVPAKKGKPEVSSAAPQNSLTIRALLQGKDAGSIIGKGGKVIQRFRDESGASINIAAGTAMERMLTVSGTSDSVFHAFQLIMFKLADEGDEHSGDLSLLLVIPDSQCGSIIEEGSAEINEIREDIGAEIYVAKEMLPDSTDRTATLTGTAEQIAQCVAIIYNIPYEPLANRGPVGDGADGIGRFELGNFPGGGDRGGNFVSSFDHFEGVGTHEMSIPNEQVGSVMGKRGSRIEEIRHVTGAAVTISKLEEGGEDGAKQERIITIKGHSEQVAMAVYMINNRCGRNDFGGRGGNIDVTTHELSIPNGKVGSVIGKSGSRIAEIRQTTGASVTISKMDEDGEDGAKQERIITIKGNSEQVAMAAHMINNRWVPYRR